MKNLPISILIAALVSSISLNAQTTNFANMKKNAITVSPCRAFTQHGEMKIGYEKQQSKTVALELNLGYRFKDTDAPQIDPYYNQTLVGSNVRILRNGMSYTPSVRRITNNYYDWTWKTEFQEYYTTHNMYVSGGYKFYLAEFKNKRVPGGLYLTTGLTIGNRGISEYKYAEGQMGKMDVLDSYSVSSLYFASGFVGTEKVVQEDIYNFTRLEIKKYSKTYLQPHLKMGIQLPIADRFSLDLGGQVTFQGKWIDRSAHIKLEPTVKLGVWF